MSGAALSGLYCSVLGPLEVRVASRKAVIGPPKQRMLLAMMLCRANTVVPSAQLVEILWGELPPRTARKNLQVYVSTLRKIVGDRIDFHGWGYRLHADRDELDLLRFRELARAGRNAIRCGDLTAAARLLGDAVQMWEEQPLAEFAHIPLIAGEVGQVTELFLSVYEDWAELEIKMGRHVERPQRGRTRGNILLRPLQHGPAGSPVRSRVPRRRLIGPDPGLRPRTGTPFGSTETTPGANRSETAVSEHGSMFAAGDDVGLTIQNQPGDLSQPAPGRPGPVLNGCTVCESKDSPARLSALRGAIPFPITTAVQLTASLTARELAAFELLGLGYDNRSIARTLSISERTTKRHITAILTKLRLESRLQAGLTAMMASLATQAERTCCRISLSMP